MRPVEEPVAGLVLGHGAAGGVGTADLGAASEVANRTGISVVLVEQPYVVAGRRSPAPARQLDAAWTAAVELLRGEGLDGLPITVGGRSADHREERCRAEDEGAIELLGPAFPVHPHGKGDDPTKSS